MLLLFLFPLCPAPSVPSADHQSHPPQLPVLSKKTEVLPAAHLVSAKEKEPRSAAPREEDNAFMRVLEVREQNLGNIPCVLGGLVVGRVEAGLGQVKSLARLSGMDCPVFILKTKKNNNRNE